MPFSNKGTEHFNNAQKSNVEQLIRDLETALINHLINLSPEERRQYGSVNEQNKLIIDKVKSYQENNPALSTPDVDWVEFNKDYETRIFLSKIIDHLEALITGLSNVKILHDWDNYQAALTDYKYTQYKNTSSSKAGYEDKEKDLKQFFTKKTPRNPPASSSTES
ncbi:MAG: hypothetical protein N4A35_11350 [Flavobacteriales bacterium]|jgi:hypothetical protein|nr:hypothetical protein [Flavobacteriales bacterium]